MSVHSGIELDDGYSGKYAIIISDDESIHNKKTVALVLKNYNIEDSSIRNRPTEFETFDIRSGGWDFIQEHKKRANIPTLHYGDCILFRKNKKDYEKIPKLYETRFSDGMSQICLTGYMKANRREFEMLEAFPNLEIPYEICHRTVPDVAVKAWVQLESSERDGRIRYRLVQFSEVDVAKQSTISKQGELTGYNDYDMKGHIFKSTDGFKFKSNRAEKLLYGKVPDFSLPHVHGIVASETAIVSPDYPYLYFRRVVIGKEPFWPSVGAYVTFGAECLDHVNFYAVTLFKPTSEVQNVSTSKNGHLKVTVRYNQELPGFFRSELLNIYVDDPWNLLEALPFSKYSGSTISVAIRDGKPMKNGRSRFYIAEVVDKKGDKLEEMKKNGDMRFEDEQAVVYDQYGRLYLPKWPNLKLRLNKRCLRLYRVGSIIRVSADYSGNEKKWIIRKLKRDPKLGRLRTAARYDKFMQKTRVFFQLSSVRGRDDLPYMVTHPIFKTIALPMDFKPIVNAKNYSLENVWITPNFSEDKIAPACKFSLFGVGEIQPVSKIQPALEFYDDESDRDYNLELYYPEDEEKEIEEDIVQMTEDTLLREEWVHNMPDAVREDFYEHEKNCDECREQYYEDRCDFIKFLTKVVDMNNDVSITLQDMELLQFVLTSELDEHEGFS